MELSPALGFAPCGVEPGDEVLLPPISFVATANAVSHLGAVPHFVDVEGEALGLCPVALADRLDAVAERYDGCILNRESGRRIARCCRCMCSAILHRWNSCGWSLMPGVAFGRRRSRSAVQLTSRCSLRSLWGRGHSQL